MQRSKQTNKELSKLLSAWQTMEFLSPYRFTKLEYAFSRRQSGVPPTATDLSDATLPLPWEINSETTTDGDDGQEEPVADGSSGTAEDSKSSKYYHIALGRIDFEGAVGQLLSKLGQEPDLEAKRVEKFTTIAAITLDERGAPSLDESGEISLDSIAVSAFAFGYPLLIDGQISRLSDWRNVEFNIKKALRSRLGSTQNGEPKPLTLPMILKAVKWLTHRLKIPPDHVSGPVAVEYRHSKNAGWPRPDLINSFYVEDLERVREWIGNSRPLTAMCQFLSPKEPISRIDLLEGTTNLQKILAPEKMPVARWPTPGDHSLVMLQQAAVNLAFDELEESEGIVAVNGPPGTGKTTLLRDMVAEVILKRAYQLSEIDDPAKAFTETAVSDTVGRKKAYCHTLSPNLLGFEMVVVSNNNAAVENVTAELPERDSIDAEFAPDYFANVAYHVVNGKSEPWGMVAAVLGNKKNCRHFQGGFWNGRTEINKAEAAKPEGKHKRFATAATLEKAAKNKWQAKKDWESARDRFIDAWNALIDYLNELPSSPEEPNLWKEKRPEKFQVSTPQAYKDSVSLRNDCFAAALELHQAFILAAADQFRQNVGILCNFFRHGRLLGPVWQHFPHLWSTFQIMVPVVSTTLASVQRLFSGMPPGSIGWLLIDEAGQASPQTAVGALARSKRAVIIGDPLQIQPVVTMLSSLDDAVCSRFKIERELWSPHHVSVQNLADRVARYSSKIGSQRVWAPLLVHRRCDEPMFSISNEVAYEGKMVKATLERDPSQIAGILGETSWIDVVGSSDDKWCQEEGEEVVQLLNRLADEGAEEPDVFIITPFRHVAEELSRLLEKNPSLLERLGVPPPTDEPAQGRDASTDDATPDPDQDDDASPDDATPDPDQQPGAGSKKEDLQKDWRDHRIGTIHRFQGKEAEAVILVLGAQSERGARGWAAATPNLVNVAVSRAKQVLYVVGNRSVWNDEPYFATLDKMLPD